MCEEYTFLPAGITHYWVQYVLPVVKTNGILPISSREFVVRVQTYVWYFRYRILIIYYTENKMDVSS